MIVHTTREIFAGLFVCSLVPVTSQRQRDGRVCERHRACRVLQELVSYQRQPGTCRPPQWTVSSARSRCAPEPDQTTMSILHRPTAARPVAIRLQCAQYNTSSVADDCNSSATLQGLHLKWITVLLYVPQFEDRLLTGNDLEGDQHKHELELLKTIWNLQTLVFIPRGGERKIVLSGVRTSWRQQRSTSGMLLRMMTTDHHHPLSTVHSATTQLNSTRRPVVQSSTTHISVAD